MTQSGPTDESTLIPLAKTGDREAFDLLVASHVARLRAVIRRMVGHPDDTDDLVQESLLRAWSALSSFRGDARFGTWLCAIGARAAIDHLRQRKRWRPRAQVAYANACLESETLGLEVGTALSSPDFAYDAREHISFCFTCVGRSLPPEEQAALLLTDVFDLKGREAAKALGVSESVLRHQLASARRQMSTAYEDLCTLVSKTGVCYQCQGLREGTHEARRGPEPPPLLSREARLEVVRAADVDRGVSQRLHDLFWRRISEIEGQAGSSEVPTVDCPP